MNIKGCTKSKHSNEKPLEPEKSPVDKSQADKVIEVTSKPLNNGISLERPSFDAVQLTLLPIISPALLEQIKGLTALKIEKPIESKIQIGQSCKNNSCKATYVDASSEEEVCNYHSGIPIFHEGLKYWSCCQKKTTEFSTFLDQPGCKKGNHVWISKVRSKDKYKWKLDYYRLLRMFYINIVYFRM